MSQPLQSEPLAFTAPSPEAVRHQLEVLVKDEVFRSSKRSIQFLRYVVEQTLSGQSESIKERTIGIEVFGRDPTYETASDHVVRTAATELRKRLSLYYSDPRHIADLKMSLTPGSYVPHFTTPRIPGEHGPATPYPEPLSPPPPSSEDSPRPVPIPDSGIHAPAKPNLPVLLLTVVVFGAVAAILGIGFAAYSWQTTHSPEYLFWRPLLDSPGTVLLAVGDIPSGPPSFKTRDAGPDVPSIQRGTSTTVPFADAVTIARVLSVLQSHGKRVIIRPEMTSSFSDFKEGPAVLIGAFNNEWSLRLTHQLRFSLALDSDRRLIYIRDAQNPSDRSWSQITGDTEEQQQMARGGPARHDYALISRVKNPETGQVVMVVGGLYGYGTQAAGEFITSPEMMRSIAKDLARMDPNSDLQLVLETAITDDTPGVPKVLKLVTK